MASLKLGVVTALTSHNLRNSQIEIESTQVHSEDEPVTSVTPSSAQQGPRHGLLRRSDGDSTKLKLFVYVNILPLSASAKNISSAKTVSKN